MEKAPQVNAGLRLIENADLMRFCKNRCDLQTLHSLLLRAVPSIWRFR